MILSVGDKVTIRDTGDTGIVCDKMILDGHVTVRIDPECLVGIVLCTRYPGSYRRTPRGTYPVDTMGNVFILIDKVEIC